jgi:predicted TIM-barrel fold metal-dependent hydrolase
VPTGDATENVVPLVDHHAHSVVGDIADRATFERYLTEAAELARGHSSAFDSFLGASLLRYCGPVLGLATTAGPDEYLARRVELGGEESNRRLLRAAGVEHIVVDHGFRAEDLVDVPELAQLAGAAVHQVVRLEHLAEVVAAQGVRPSKFADKFAQRLAEALSGPSAAVGCKSVMAYRHGLDVSPIEPGPGEVRRATEEWLSAARGSPRGTRISHPVLLRHLVWAALRTGAPLQIHTGYGDADLELHRSNPALLTRLIRLAAPLGAPIMLLHCYPYHREAAYLAGVYEHVYFDIGLAINYAGYRATEVLAEAVETAPLHKFLYSSDAFGLAELHLLAAVNFREALAHVLQPLITHDSRSQDEVARLAAMIGSGTARHVYGLPEERRP